ncbi:MAG: hypothetical protein ABSG79_19025 [Bryobacteraceae bacterium]|jgi:hypothetical protein
MADIIANPDYEEVRVMAYDEAGLLRIKAEREANGWRLENSSQSPDYALGNEEIVLCFRRIIP